MNLILFGFKGSGKTHFGKLLSQRLHRPFLDTDIVVTELYAKQSGKLLSPREIYQINAFLFRSLEKKAIEGLRPHLNAIIAVGGGAVLDRENALSLPKLGKCIYLRASFATIQSRLLQSELPSFIDPKDPVNSLYRIYRERMPLYEAIPAETLDIDRFDETTTLSILQSLSQHGF